MSGWPLHPQLAADTHAVASWPLCELLLMDDAQYPWLILVPRVDGARELIDLAPSDQHRLLDEIARASRLLRTLFAPDKLNVAALGNVVPQLHVHVIARFRDDAAWPRSVWGVHPPLRHAAEALETMLRRLRAAADAP